MKRLLTGTLLGLMSIVAWAGGNLDGSQALLPKKMTPAQEQQLEQLKSEFRSTGTPGDRAQTIPIEIDYDGCDEVYTTNTLVGEYSRFIWPVNKNWDALVNPNAGFRLDWAAVVFDTTGIFDAAGCVDVARSAYNTVNLDSFVLFFTHENSGGNDTLTVKVVEWGNQVSEFPNGQGPTATYEPANILWEETLIDDTQSGLGQTNSGTQLSTLTFAPNIDVTSFLGAGSGTGGFAVLIEFAGDTLDSDFNVLAGFRDECAEACGAETALYSGTDDNLFGANSIYYVNADLSSIGGSELSGINPLAYTCGPPCEQFEVQNIVLLSFLTAETEFSNSVSASAANGCPGDIVDLDVTTIANGGNVTYSWTTSDGTLSSNSGASVQLSLGQTDALVTMIATDGSEFDTVTTLIQSAGISVAVNSNPSTLECGQTATITANASGNTVGASYAWSNGGSSFQISVVNPGTYTVTVTNNSGCSTTGTATIAPGSTNQNVSFTVTTPNSNSNTPVTGCNVTLTNTSTNLSGWTWTWDFDGTGFVGQDAVFRPTATGSYDITLTGDSAACSFSSVQTIQVNVNTLGCTGIFELSKIANLIDLYPNPNAGNFTLNLSAIDGEEASVEVYNLQGKRVYANNVNIVTNGVQNIELANANTGIYLVKVNVDGEVATKKVMINK